MFVFEVLYVTFTLKFFDNLVMVDLVGRTILKQACCGGLGLEKLHTKGRMVQ